MLCFFSRICYSKNKLLKRIFFCMFIGKKKYIKTYILNEIINEYVYFLI